MVESNQKGIQDPEEGGLQHQQSTITENNDEALKAELAKLEDELGEGKSFAISKTHNISQPDMSNLSICRVDNVEE